MHASADASSFSNADAVLNSAMDMNDDEEDETLLVGFSAGALYKRADFLDKEEVLSVSLRGSARCCMTN